MKIFLIRHGQTDKNNTDLIGQDVHEKLNATGKLQAESLGKYLNQRIKFDKIFCSSYTRAQDTCKIVIDQFIDPLPFTVVDELKEYNSGSLKGKKRSIIYNSDLGSKIYFLGMQFKYPNGESLVETQQRAMNWLYDNVLLKYNNENIAIFSHGLTIRCMIQSIMNYDHKMIWRFSIDNTSFSIFEFKNNNWFIKSINNTPHLIKSL